MPLLPPRVKGPLSECSTRVRVEGQLTSADVQVFADGILVAQGIAGGPSDVFSLSTTLGPGQQVTATQTVGLETSPASPEPVIVQAKPPMIGPVAFATHLHVCGQCIWIEGVIPGAIVEIFSPSGPRGTGEGFDGVARLGLNAPIAPGEILSVHQIACGNLGPDTAGPSPDFPGGEQHRRLPPPQVEDPLRACQRGVLVSSVYDGAIVTLLRSGGPNLQACFDRSGLRFNVNPGLVEGETVSALQTFPNCEIESDPCPPVVVGPAEPVPPPTVHGPLCVGSVTVRLSNLLYGSRIRIFYDGVEIGTGEAPEEGTFDFPVPPLGPTAPHGSFVTAQQELCGIWSDLSNAVEVDPRPVTLEPPIVTEPLFVCGAAVHVTNVHPGSRVYVFSAMLGAPIGEMQVFASEAVIPVAPLLMANDEIFAIQVGCGQQSGQSNLVRVQSLPNVRPPTVPDPVYDCQTTVLVRDVIPGARVEIYVNGAFRGSVVTGKDEVEVPVIGVLAVGDEVRARQRICEIITELGPGTRVQHFDGRWIAVGDANKAEILAVHAALLRTNRILYFGGDQHTMALNQSGDIDHTRLFDCDTYAITPVTGLSAPADLFCAGHAQLPDGRILVGGGTHAWDVPPGEDPHGHDPSGHFIGSRESWIFDPADHQWHRTNPLVTQRPDDPERAVHLDIERTGGKWYPTLLTLSDGKVLAVSGHPREFDTRHNNNTLEWYESSSGSWNYVGSVDCDFVPRYAGRSLEYPRIFVLPDSRVLSVSEMQDGNLKFWNVGNAPNSWTTLTTPQAGYGGNPLPHTAVLFPLRPSNYTPRVLMCGESVAWVLRPTTSPTWRATARVLFGHPDPGDMNPRRENLDAVILPTGEIFIEGGAKSGTSDATGVKRAEIFDPETTSRTNPDGTWRVLPAAQEVRNYHSVALLMPNGAVWVAGSNINSGTGLGNRNLWIEIFEPWYFCYPRPQIQAAPTLICPDDQFEIRSPQAINKNIEQVVLVRCGTCTHNFNPDQRLIELTFEYGKGDRLIAMAPPDNHIAPPGYYLLFILNKQRVPSRGVFIQVCQSPVRRGFRWPGWRGQLLDQDPREWQRWVATNPTLMREMIQLLEGNLTVEEEQPRRFRQAKPIVEPGTQAHPHGPNGHDHEDGGDHHPEE